MGVGPGELCAADIIDHPCIEQHQLVFSCPEGNDEEGRPPDVEVGSYPRARCRVCAMEPAMFNDTDPRPSIVAGSFTFGPNSLDGEVNETGIANYQVWMVDDCGVMLGDSAIAKVEVNPGLEPACCTPEAYRVNFYFQLPPNMSNTSLMVVPFLEGSGLLKLGSIAGVVYDYDSPNEAGRLYGVRTGAACERGLRSVWAVVGVAAALALLASVATHSPLKSAW